LAAQLQRQIGVIKTGRFLTGGDVGNFLTLNANRFIKGRAVMLIANFIKRRGLIRLQADAKKGVLLLHKALSLKPQAKLKLMQPLARPQ